MRIRAQSRGVISAQASWPSGAGTAWRSLLSWPRRRWAVATFSAVAAGAFIGLSTAMIPNPLFGRAVPTTWWAWFSLVVTAGLSGLLAATYIRGATTAERASRTGLAGGLLSYLAVGCPVCNKIVVIAIGASGAMTWFAPVQPALAIASLVFMVVAVRTRLLNQYRCALPRVAA